MSRENSSYSKYVKETQTFARLYETSHLVFAKKEKKTRKLNDIRIKKGYKSIKKEVLIKFCTNIDTYP